MSPNVVYAIGSPEHAFVKVGKHPSPQGTTRAPGSD